MDVPWKGSRSNRNGVDALEKIEELNPDLLTLDVEMPGMDGIEVLRRIRQRRLRPRVIMVSSFTSAGAQVTTDALLEGAFDFILKPSGRDSGDTQRRLRDAFDTKIAALRDTTQREKHRSLHVAQAPAASIDQIIANRPTVASGCQAVLLGTSTGGPAALKIVLPRLPATLSAPMSALPKTVPLLSRKSANSGLHLSSRTSKCPR